MLVLFSLVEHLKFGIDHKVSTILLLMSLMTSGEGRFFFPAFQKVSLFPHPIAISCPRFRVQVTLNLEKMCIPGQLKC